MLTASGAMKSPIQSMSGALVVVDRAAVVVVVPGETVVVDGAAMVVVGITAVVVVVVVGETVVEGDAPVVVDTTAVVVVGA